MFINGLNNHGIISRIIVRVRDAGNSVALVPFILVATSPNKTDFLRFGINTK
jgi:hypothetical protein